jgi:rubrerythrin
MNNEQDEWVCTECGYTSTIRFVGDICPNCGMTYWRCSMCGFTMVDAVPPDVCPECHENCEFINLGCYIPGWKQTDALNSNFLGN